MTCSCDSVRNMNAIRVVFVKRAPVLIPIGFRDGFIHEGSDLFPFSFLKRRGRVDE